MMPRRRRRLASRIRAFVCGFIAFLFSNVGVIVLVVGYTIAGAFMFQAIEGGEREVDRNMTRSRHNLTSYLWHNVTLEMNLFNETALREKIGIELDHYQHIIVRAVRSGWDGGLSSKQWSFSSAFLYSLTVITTIGYGHLSPRTDWGKVVTILYALLGMPLFLLYLTNVGELLARWFKCIYALVCLCRGCPGFTRRRVARLRQQYETSEAESIERPIGWRSQSESDVTPPPSRRNPQEYSIPHSSRLQNYPVPSERYPRVSEYPISQDRYPRIPEYEVPQRHARILEYDEERYGRIREEGGYSERYPRISNDRYQSMPPMEMYSRNCTRRAGYGRSVSMPQGRHVDRRHAVRGASEPPRAPPSDGSSEFSIVTFDAQTITVPISVCVSIMVGYILFGSMIFTLWETWDRLDGAYFCFISLSSIGFGDFVPGERVYTERIDTSFIVCSMYLMLGMALVAMCFNLMQEQVIHYFAGLKRALKRISRCKR